MTTSTLRSFRFDPLTDDLLNESAAREGVSLTEAARRAIVTRSELRRELLTHRLFVRTDPDRPIPPGFVELRYLGGV